VKKILCVMLAMMTLMVFSGAFAADKLIVLMDWFMNPDHAPLFVAQEQGFFKQQQLDVELVGPADPSDPPKLVAAGKADIAITYQPQFMLQVDNGLPLVMVGTLIDKPLNCLVVLQNSGIKSLADLKGKRIGYSNSGMNNAALKVMLAQNGVAFNEVEPINVHYDLTQALLSGKVDAVTGMMRNFEVTQMELAGHPARSFFPEQNGLPVYSELIFIAQKKSVADNRIARFLTAVNEGLKYLRQHPESTWQAFAKAYPELNNELNHRAWISTLPYFAENTMAFDAKNFLRFAVFLQQNGVIKSVQPLSQYKE
jgi:putative hydroxymethylpyrimidine transport system substrate-binding protein